MMQAEAAGFIPTISRAGKAILHVHIKAVLRHAVAKHDPNAGQRDARLLCDRTYSSNINNRRKT